MDAVRGPADGGPGAGGAPAAVDERLITGEELAAMPGAPSCELIDGRIVPMAPTSGERGRIEASLGAMLREFVRSRRLGQVMVGEVGIYTRRDPDRVRAADALFVSSQRYARHSQAAAFLDVAPDLVVEILSANDTVMDLAEKLREYFAIGVRLVWVIDPRARCLYAYRSPTDIREFRQDGRVPGDDVLPGLEIPVAAIFED
jgi:Uma2 family endonuclease